MNAWGNLTCFEVWMFLRECIFDWCRVALKLCPILCYRGINPPLSQETPYRQLSWLYVVCINIWLLLAPSQLSPDWRYGAVPLIQSVGDWNNLSTVACFAALIAMSLLGVRRADKNGRAMLIGISLMVVTFLPASNLFLPVGFVVAERVLYLPSMGFCLLVAYGLWNLLCKVSGWRVLSTLTWALVFYMLCVHGIKTLTRNRA